MNKVIYIHSTVATAKLICPEQLGEKILESDFLYAYIPSIRVCESESTDFDCKIIITDNAVNSVRINYPTGYYRSSSPDIKDIVSLVEYMLERARQEKGVFCIHSSSVITKKSAIIFWGGATGMGKTLGALTMAHTNKATMFSDEKTLISLKSSKVLGGINKIYLSKQYLKDNFKNDSYLKINTPQITDTPICMMVYPFINEVKKVQIEKWDNKKYEWHLYEELCRKIRGTSRRFFDNSIPIDSIDTKILARKRIELIRAFIKKVPNYSIQCNTRKLAKNILNLL